VRCVSAQWCWCWVERLMRALGLAGAVWGKKVRTTVPGPDGARATDLVKRQFTAGAPNRLWVTDFTYVSTWAGTVYTAFAVDVFSRKIIGWKKNMSKEAGLVLDTIEMGIHARDCREQDEGCKLVHHSDAGSQYTSFWFAQHLIDSGVDTTSLYRTRGGSAGGVVLRCGIEGGEVSVDVVGVGDAEVGVEG
jgi:putative transposase